MEIEIKIMPKGCKCNLITKNDGMNKTDLDVSRCRCFLGTYNNKLYFLPGICFIRSGPCTWDKVSFPKSPAVDVHVTYSHLQIVYTQGILKCRQILFVCWKVLLIICIYQQREEIGEEL